MPRPKKTYPSRPVYPMRPVLSWDDVPIICLCSDVARVLQCTVEKVQRMAARGEIPAFKVGPEWRIRREDLIAYTTPRDERENVS